jgi:hypothetical protein
MKKENFLETNNNSALYEDLVRVLWETREEQGLSLMDIARAILQEFSKAEVEALIEDLQEGLKLK